MTSPGQTAYSPTRGPIGSRGKSCRSTGDGPERPERTGRRGSMRFRLGLLIGLPLRGMGCTDLEASSRTVGRPVATELGRGPRRNDLSPGMPRSRGLAADADRLHPGSNLVREACAAIPRGGDLEPGRTRSVLTGLDEGMAGAPGFEPGAGHPLEPLIMLAPKRPLTAIVYHRCPPLAAACRR